MLDFDLNWADVVIEAVLSNKVVDIVDVVVDCVAGLAAGGETVS